MNQPFVVLVTVNKVLNINFWSQWWKFDTMNFLFVFVQFHCGQLRFVTHKHKLELLLTLSADSICIVCAFLFPFLHETLKTVFALMRAIKRCKILNKTNIFSMNFFFITDDMEWSLGPQCPWWFARCTFYNGHAYIHTYMKYWIQYS